MSNSIRIPFMITSKKLGGLRQCRRIIHLGNLGLNFYSPWESWVIGSLIRNGQLINVG
jgi:hypothetical protein